MERAAWQLGNCGAKVVPEDEASTAEQLVEEGTDEAHRERRLAAADKGIDKKFMTNVGPNETKTLHVELKSGTYKVYCPVGEHEEHGMKLELTVK